MTLAVSRDCEDHFTALWVTLTLLHRQGRVAGVAARVTLPLVSRDSTAFESYDQLSKSIGFSVAAAPQVAYYGNHLVLGIIRGHFIAS